MSSVSFDRAAEYYDATRGYAKGSDNRIRDAIVAYAGAGKTTRFLELGVGTGRIALPFIRAGYDYTGIDISSAMMDRLAAKLAGDQGASEYRYQLHQADITHPPFDDSSFDVIIAVHVLHLVADWQRVVREAKRVLRPGGWMLFGYDHTPGESGASDNLSLPPPLRVLRKWMELRRERSLDKPAGRSNLWGDDGRLSAYLQALGATTDTIVLAKYEQPAISAREMADRVKARLFSADWEISDDRHAEMVRQLDEWMNQAIATPDEPATIAGEFMAVTATWLEYVGGVSGEVEALS